MSGEAAMWRVVRTKLAPFGRIHRIERNEDIPDTAYTLRSVSGWMEFKHAIAWPKPGAPVKFGHPPTRGQVIWLEEEQRVGGRAWCLAQVADNYLLLPPRGLRLVFEGEPWDTVKQWAVVHEAGFPTTRILEALISDQRELLRATFPLAVHR